MITGDDERATLACDWPGCTSLIEMARVTDEPAIDAVQRVAADYFCWSPGTTISPEFPPLDICGAHSVDGWIPDTD